MGESGGAERASVNLWHRGGLDDQIGHGLRVERVRASSYGYVIQIRTNPIVEHGFD